MKFPLFVNGAYRALSPTADDEQTINWYPEVYKDEAPGAVTDIALYSTPGIRNFLTVPAQIGGRAAFSQNGRCFFVIGSQLIEVFKDGTHAVLGDVGNDGFPAQIVSSGIVLDQMVICSAGSVFLYDLQPDPPLPAPPISPRFFTVLTPLNTLVGPNNPAYYSHIGYSYGFFQALDQNNSLFRISINPLIGNGGMVWDDLDFQARSLAGDPWKAMLTTSYGETWLLGEQTSEVWYNNADPDFPYAPDPSGSIPYGIVAPFSLCEANDKVCWVGTTKDGDLAVLAAQGFTPVRISDLALEAEFDTYDRLDDAEGETYRQAGHTFYKLTFPSAFPNGIRRTWVYDFQTKLWHRRGTWLGESAIFDEWRPQWFAFFNGQHLWSDRESGQIMESRPDFVTDIDNRPLRRVRVSPTIRSEGKRLTHRRLEVLIEAGIRRGSDNQLQSDPEVVHPVMMLRTSDDGGKTWGNELTQPMGDLGDYRQRLVWEKLGQSVARTYELSCTEAIPVRVIDAFIEVDA